jgi:O-acetyl-ADP-ribose deacetylase (regulator of RNase III)
MPFTIIRNDVTKLKVEAIVNAANTDLAQGGGVCGAIFKAAGAKELKTACDALAPIKTGKAVMTSGFNLPAKHIIHTAGPVYRGGKNNEEARLRACYINSLKLAAAHNLESVAFPLISSGIYGYPKAEALRVATDAIRNFISEYDMDVTLVVFDKEALSVSEELLGSVQSYIDEHYVDEHLDARRSRRLLDVEREALSDEEMADYTVAMLSCLKQHQRPQRTALMIWSENLDEPFSATLMRLIDRTGKIDAEIYRRANIDAAAVLQNSQQCPLCAQQADCAGLRHCVGAESRPDERPAGACGFALSIARKFDVIVEYLSRVRKTIFRD